VIDGISRGQGERIDLGALPEALVEEMPPPESDKLGYQPLSGPRGVADDLKKFPGVSPAIEKQLNDLGIFHVWQIAELSPVAAHNIGEEVGLPGRVEAWIARAKEQMATEAE
jgi:small subunit ribosomal protein S2